MCDKAREVVFREWQEASDVGMRFALAVLAVRRRRVVNGCYGLMKEYDVRSLWDDVAVDLRQAVSDLCRRAWKANKMDEYGIFVC